MFIKNLLNKEEFRIDRRESSDESRKSLTRLCMFSKKTTSLLRLAIVLHLCGLLATLIIRIGLFGAMRMNGGEDLVFGTDFLHALVLGVWFDNVMECYLSGGAVFLIVLLAVVCNRQSETIFRILGSWYAVGNSLLLFISVVNIPYFLYFFQIINSSAFQWLEYPATTIGMLLEEKLIAIYILLAFFLIVGNVLCIRQVLTRAITNWNTDILHLIRKSHRMADAGLLGIVILLCMFGVRGRMGYNPIKVSQAYFCTDPRLNQLGISPAFNLLTSVYDDLRPENQHLALMPDTEAITYVQNTLHTQGIEGKSPIVYPVLPDSSRPAINPNIVILLMESMSKKLLDKGMTPFLDSLREQSLWFENAYSSGNHTNHGVFSTLYGWPVLMFRNTMKSSVVGRFQGLPTILAHEGYTNLFFMTHESQYDNMKAFLMTNGFHEIYSQENYPSEAVVNSFGVQDDYLYNFAINTLDKKSGVSKPFFAVLLSISNHPPYVLPKDFQPHHKEIEKAIVEYADWSLSNFFAQARKKSWYKNTLFVLVGDHGKITSEQESELPESMNHVPLAIMGAGVQNKVRKDFVLQEDIMHTILSICNVPYVHNGLGLDALTQKRDYAFYAGDKYIAARDSCFLYLYNPSEKKEFFYDLSGTSPKKIKGNKKSKNMGDYTKAMHQMTQYAMEHYLTNK